MKIATLAMPEPKTPSEARDGRLVVVSADHCRGAFLPEFPTLLGALETWQVASGRIFSLSRDLEAGRVTSPIDLRDANFMAPLPRCWAWLDGSAFLHHVLLVRKARNAEPPADLRTVPLMYQGISDNLLGPKDDLVQLDFAHGMDFEAEIAVVTDDVPRGTTVQDAADHIKLLLLMNDISLRELIPRELQTGFGFFHGKPASSFGPFAITPDEAGDAWKDGRLHLDMRVVYNGKPFGCPNGREMHFSFPELIAHAAKTRRLSAGTIIGSGTVSNEDPSVGSTCLVERRMIEKIASGQFETPYMKAGDTLEIDMIHEGRSLFGKISQRVSMVGTPVGKTPSAAGV